MNPMAFVLRASYITRGVLYRLSIIVAGGRCGPGLRVEGGFRLRHGPHEGISIGKNVYIGFGSVIDCPKSGTLVIGSNVTFTHGVFISAAKSVSIGDDALIGEYVSIRDANHQTELNRPMRLQPMAALGCEIGSDVWIGRGCAILSGARLKTGCVIGANSVVKGEIPKHTVAVGSPARVVKPRTGLTAGQGK